MRSELGGAEADLADRSVRVGDGVLDQRADEDD
jgi:hypothetical protein